MIEILKEFEGIIGAFVGIVATLITSHILKNAGTVKTHQEGFIYTAHHNNSNGFNDYGQSLGGTVTAFEIDGALLFENTSENTKAIHNIKLIFNTSDGPKYKALQDSSSIRKSGGGIAYDTVTHANISPKEIIPLNARMRSDLTDISYHPDRNDVFLSYEIADKKLFKNKKVKLNIN